MNHTSQWADTQNKMYTNKSKVVTVKFVCRIVKLIPLKNDGCPFLSDKQNKRKINKALHASFGSINPVWPSVCLVHILGYVIILTAFFFAFAVVSVHLCTFAFFLCSFDFFFLFSSPNVSIGFHWHEKYVQFNWMRSAVHKCQNQLNPCKTAHRNEVF